MNRKYQTSSTMYIDKFTEKVVQPDAGLISTLHSVLDTLPEEKAAIIDITVAQLLRFHDPNIPRRFAQDELIMPGDKK